MILCSYPFSYLSLFYLFMNYELFCGFDGKRTMCVLIMLFMNLFVSGVLNGHEYSCRDFYELRYGSFYIF